MLGFTSAHCYSEILAEVNFAVYFNTGRISPQMFRYENCRHPNKISYIFKSFYQNKTCAISECKQTQSRAKLRGFSFKKAIL